METFGCPQCGVTGPIDEIYGLRRAIERLVNERLDEARISDDYGEDLTEPERERYRIAYRVARETVERINAEDRSTSSSK